MQVNDDCLVDETVTILYWQASREQHCGLNLRNMIWKWLLISYALLVSAHDTEDPRQLWTEWKQTHERSYHSELEEAIRYDNFLDTIRFVNERNQEYETPIFGLTQFADLTHEEFTDQYLTPNIMEYAPPEGQPDEDLVTLQSIPPSMDWRNKNGKNYVSGTRNQGSCGSCWVFSAVGVFESHYLIKKGGRGAIGDIDFSEQQVLDCNAEGHHCDGGYPQKAMNYVVRNGLLLEKDYGNGRYMGKQGRCVASNLAQKKKIWGTGYKHTSRDVGSLVWPAIANAPVGILVAADKEFSAIVSDQVVFRGRSCPQNQNHAIVAVGYGTSNGLKYNLIKNSWGSRWGNNGFARIEVCACATCSALHYPTGVAVDNPTPQCTSNSQCPAPSQRCNGNSRQWSVCVNGQCGTESENCGTKMCQNGNCVTRPATCTDGKQNQGEAGIDCGGPCPKKCAACSNGQTQACTDTASGCPGTRGCVNQQWGTCVKRNTCDCSKSSQCEADKCSTTDKTRIVSHECENYKCVLKLSKCANGGICENGGCKLVPACTTDAQCGQTRCDGQILIAPACKNGACVDVPTNCGSRICDPNLKQCVDNNVPEPTLDATVAVTLVFDKSACSAGFKATHADEYISEVNSIYTNSFSGKLKISIQKRKAEDHCTGDPFEVSTDPRRLIHAASAYHRNNHRDADVLVWLTKKTLTRNVNDYAYINRICNPMTSATLVIIDSAKAITINRIAHVIAHTLGARHDGDRFQPCPINKHIMTPRLTIALAPVFSTCTVNDIARRLSQHVPKCIADSNPNPNPNPQPTRMELKLAILVDQLMSQSCKPSQCQIVNTMQDRLQSLFAAIVPNAAIKLVVKETINPQMGNTMKIFTLLNSVTAMAAVKSVVSESGVDGAIFLFKGQTADTLGVASKVGTMCSGTSVAVVKYIDSQDVLFTRLAHAIGHLINLKNGDVTGIMSNHDKLNAQQDFISTDKELIRKAFSGNQYTCLQSNIKSGYMAMNSCFEQPDLTFCYSSDTDSYGHCMGYECITREAQCISLNMSPAKCDDEALDNSCQYLYCRDKDNEDLPCKRVEEDGMMISVQDGTRCTNMPDDNTRLCSLGQCISTDDFLVVKSGGFADDCDEGDQCTVIRDDRVLEGICKARCSKCGHDLAGNSCIPTRKAQCQFLGYPDSCQEKQMKGSIHHGCNRLWCQDPDDKSKCVKARRMNTMMAVDDGTACMHNPNMHCMGHACMHRHQMQDDYAKEDWFNDTNSDGDWYSNPGLLLDCYNDCYDHGECDPNSGECECFEGWGGKYCEHDTKRKITDLSDCKRSDKPGSYSFYFLSNPRTDEDVHIPIQGPDTCVLASKIFQHPTMNSKTWVACDHGYLDIDKNELASISNADNAVYISVYYELNSADSNDPHSNGQQLPSWVFLAVIGGGTTVVVVGVACVITSVRRRRTRETLDRVDTSIRRESECSYMTSPQQDCLLHSRRSGDRTPN